MRPSLLVAVISSVQVEGRRRAYVCWLSRIPVEPVHMMLIRCLVVCIVKSYISSLTLWFT